MVSDGLPLLWLSSHTVSFLDESAEEECFEISEVERQGLVVTRVKEAFMLCAGLGSPGAETKRQWMQAIKTLIKSSLSKPKLPQPSSLLPLPLLPGNGTLSKDFSKNISKECLNLLLSKNNDHVGKDCTSGPEAVVVESSQTRAGEGATPAHQGAQWKKRAVSQPKSVARRRRSTGSTWDLPPPSSPTLTSSSMILPPPSSSAATTVTSSGCSAAFAVQQRLQGPNVSRIELRIGLSRRFSGMSVSPAGEPQSAQAQSCSSNTSSDCHQHHHCDVSAKSGNTVEDHCGDEHSNRDPGGSFVSDEAGLAMAGSGSNEGPQEEQPIGIGSRDVSQDSLTGRNMDAPPASSQVQLMKSLTEYRGSDHDDVSAANSKASDPLSSSSSSVARKKKGKKEASKGTLREKKQMEDIKKQYYKDGSEKKEEKEQRKMEGKELARKKKDKTKNKNKNKTKRQKRIQDDRELQKAEEEEDTKLKRMEPRERSTGQEEEESTTSITT